MKWSLPAAALLLLAAACTVKAEEEKEEKEARPKTIVLDETRIRNLGIQTVEASPETFEETVFALGRIEVFPGKKAVVSSRIPGRAVTVLAKPDMRCEQGDELVWVESRQPGDPPPTIRLDAPIAGTIATVSVSAGQPVEPNDSLIEIIDLSTVEAGAALPEYLAGRVKKGQKARIRVPAFPGHVIDAEVAHLGAEADPAAGTLEAAFHLPNPDELLRPGMRAEFSIIVESREDVMSVPADAVQGDAGGRFVFIKDYELKNAFMKIPVVTGAQNDRVVEIVSGLNPGDEVVTKGAYALGFGEGSVSLKEALDAAHGHPHNEDGSEMTKEQIAAAKGGDGHAHGEGEGEDGSLFWKITSGALLLLLVASALRPRRAAPAAPVQAG